ncbi:hypothetical protein TNIN_42981 [Trichonephila inaurata madagascariensis]|uniref:Uncharacterized protein n=1 Tax=Trichonephila inaurata madagascariensis TaxID=2747483 RepID=A0A8X7CRK5_9ARAC|nr:hypothetical protein TNIN_42981 [Trichonephila inaurata madagascariensis]
MDGLNLSGCPRTLKYVIFEYVQKKQGISSFRAFKIFLLNLADSKAPINSNLGSVKVFKGAILFLEAIIDVRISLLDDVTRRSATVPYAFVLASEKDEVRVF